MYPEINNGAGLLAPIPLLDVDQVERDLLKRKDLHLQIANHFTSGYYVRELTRKKTTFIIGHKHRTRHLNVLVSGHLRVFMNGSVHDIVAPAMFVSEPGVRKMTYALEDSTLMTIHPTTERDLDKLEELLVEKSESFLEDLESQNALKAITQSL